MKKAIFAGLMLFFPSLAWAAAGRDNWMWLLVFAAGFSVLLSVILVWRSKKLNTFALKAVGFGAWFWFIIFIEVMCYGFYVGLTK